MDNIEFIKERIKELRTYGDLDNLGYEEPQELAYALEDLLKYKEKYNNLVKKIQEKKEENFENAAKRIKASTKKSRVYVEKYVNILLYNTIDDLLNDLLKGDKNV